MRLPGTEACAEFAVDAVAGLVEAWGAAAAWLAAWLAGQGWLGRDRRPIPVGPPRNRWEAHLLRATAPPGAPAADDRARRRVAALFAGGRASVRDFCAEFPGDVAVRVALERPGAPIVEALLRITGTGTGTGTGAGAGSAVGPRPTPRVDLTWWRNGESQTAAFTETCAPGLLFAAATRRERAPRAAKAD